MIDIKELRAGAHVEIAGHRCRLAAIDSLNNEVGIELYVMDEAGWKYPKGYKVNDIEPIPITAELLQELGFESYHYCWVKKPNGNPIKVEDNEDGSWGVSVIGANITVRYLHELEAFVYMTTKTELIKED